MSALSPAPQLEPFCAAALSRVLEGGRQVVFVGDSLAKQTFSSFLCKLHRAGIRMEVDASNANWDNRIWKVCGKRHCTFDADAPAAAKQTGPEFGTAVRLGLGGRLHLWRPEHLFSDRSQNLSHYFSYELARVVAALQLTREDTFVIFDMASHRSSWLDDPSLAAAASSLVSFARQGASPRIVWLDYSATHFPQRPDGEFQFARGRTRVIPSDQCVGGHDHVDRARIPSPVSTRTAGTECRPHRCEAMGVGNKATLPSLLASSSSHITIVRSFHALAQVHIAHPGNIQINNTAWPAPDCRHWCQPSGADELRTGLVYNALLNTRPRTGV